MRHLTVLTAVLAAVALLVVLSALGRPPQAAENTPPATEATEAPPPAPALAPQAGDEEPEEQEDDVVEVKNADRLEYDAARDISYLSGNVVFAHKDVTVYCDEFWYDGEDDSGRAVGHLRVTDPNTTITGDLITIDFEEEKALISGNVTLVTQRKKEKNKSSETAEPKEGEAEEKPKKLEEHWEKKTTATCQKIVYYYADDIKKAILYGPIKAVQEDKTVWADQAIYEDLKDIITLMGNVRVVTEKGDEFRCPKAVISVEEDWIRAEEVTGIVLRRTKEKTEPRTTP